MNTTTKESLDDIFDRITNHVYHPCKVCGKPEACWSEDSHCDECWDASPEKAAQVAEKERKITEVARRFATDRLAGIVSPEIRATDINHPEFNGETWERIKSAFDPESPDWFWLHSHTSGRCKSRIAYLLLLEQYASGIKKQVDESGSYRGNLPRAVWVDGDRLTEACRVRHQYSLGNEVMTEAHELVEAARTAPFLVIDDLSKRKITGEAASDGLWEIIKHRHEWKLRTIITDNFLPEDLEGMLHPKHSPYIIRRLAERCIQVDFDATASGCSPSGQSFESLSGESSLGRS
jgi:hypothetical protein